MKQSGIRADSEAVGQSKPAHNSPSALRSGLLWALLGKPGRRRVAAMLDRVELERLAAAVREYPRAAEQSRGAAVSDLRSLLGERRARWPLAVSAAFAVLFGILFPVHVLWKPGFPMDLRILLFQPLFLAIFAPLSLYLLSPIRLRSLFAAGPRFSTALMTLLVFLFLLWALAFIGVEQRKGGAVASLDVLATIIFVVGAVAAPLLEEVLFRELFPGLFGRLLYVGHLFSAALFAVAHLSLGPWSVNMFLWYLFAGLALSALRIYSEGLLAPFVAHALANGVIAAGGF